ncbi:sulfatase-like hydrolase/transferase [Fodinisporobacter ferrooxydans]|uniref:Sulfatase-like hydrolase/transferase n=1 Tax=Fodinisporobacter ferrooxydans TaxID=2901836 RepID=A0ABY4CEM7_9BACL|nr:sulfatase-like hydrolase/transferase [Alicyclobacillaceae bacterium MYW30-H2]
MNVLFIMTDEHRKDAMGCANHSIVKTPNLDKLAENGVRFTNAYCNSPLCVPSRASFATGRYVHEIKCWDNAKPYSGNPESWGHFLSENGVSVTTVGKLHFLDGGGDGFYDQRFPEHLKLPGDIEGLYRDPIRKRKDGRNRIIEACEGDFWVDRTEQETEEAIRFLKFEAAKKDKPWVLWVSYLPPHFPLIVPEKYYKMYPEQKVDLPFDNPSLDNHPILDELRLHFDGQNIDEATLRKTRSAYYGLCSFIDDHVGRVLQVLKDSGLEEDTLVIYTSDHGESLGDHDLWWKCSMYEESVGIPLIISGPGIPKGSTISSPVSLIDITSTIAESVGIQPHPEWKGKSLLQLLNGNAIESQNEIVFSEYHAHGTSHGIFMIRKGKYKYIYFPHNRSQLFDLESDPKEMVNLAENPAFEEIKAQLYYELRKIVDPERIDAQALADQKQRLKEYQQHQELHQ